MLLLESCPSYQSRPSTMTRSMHLFLTRMGRLTLYKIAASRYYNTLQDSRMACPIRRNAQCCQQDGRSNCNLIIKRTLCCHCHACRQWLSRGAFLGSEHFVLYSAGILLNGYNFHGSARHGVARPGRAWRGAARQGSAWRGLANTLHPFGGAEVCSARLGAAGRGAARHGRARHGLARQGKANTLHPFGGAEVCLAWRGGARLGGARQGTAWLGKANTLRSTERSS